jgi:hypothetical protein
MRSYEKRFVQLISLVAIIGMTLTTVWGETHNSRPNPDELAKVVQTIEDLNTLRSGLAGTLKGREAPVDKDTFKQVCKPVGMQAKKMAQENGWKVIQMAAKYRNPAHQLDTEGRWAYSLMEGNKTLTGLWKHSELNGQPGIRYFRRITVEAACLACHGPQDKRPAFVKQGYPNDRAYDFHQGDLRGIYAVFVPHQK